MAVGVFLFEFGLEVVIELRVNNYVIKKVQIIP